MSQWRKQVEDKSFSDREGGKPPSIKITVLTFLAQKSTMYFFGEYFFFLRYARVVLVSSVRKRATPRHEPQFNADVRLPVVSPPSHFAPVTQPPIPERGILYWKHVCFDLWLKERGI